MSPAASSRLRSPMKATAAGLPHRSAASRTLSAASGPGGLEITAITSTVGSAAREASAASMPPNNALTRFATAWAFSS